MVYTLGESLLDIIFTGPGQVVANAGGSMLNTAVSLARKDIYVSLISELGDDHTAVFIIDFLKQEGINTKYIKKYFRQKTSVALAHLDEHKVPAFSIYKSYPAQRRLLQPPSFNQEDILVFGSMYSLDQAIRQDVREMAVRARQQGAIICFDPNIRTHKLSEPAIRDALFENIALADVVKASDEDMKTIFGEQEPAACYNEIKKINGDVMFILTQGIDGAWGFCNDFTTHADAQKVEVVSTIGAGDAFSAGIVYLLIEQDVNRQYLKTNSNILLKDLLYSGTKFSAAVCASSGNYLPSNSL